MNADKKMLLSKINALRKEIDGLVDLVISLEEPQPSQPEKFSNSQYDQDMWLTPKQVCKQFNIAYTTFFEWVRTGKLPPGCEISSKSKRWRMSDIEAWFENNQNSRVYASVAEQPDKQKRRGRPSRVKKLEELCYV